MMDDQKLKNMWTQINNYLDFQYYGIESIEKFIARKSNSIFSKIKQNMVMVAIFQAIALLFMIMDIIFYYPDQLILSLTTAALILFMLIINYEIGTYRRIMQLETSSKNTLDNLASLNQFLGKNKLFMVLSFISTNVIVFPAGIIFYFYLVYGHIKLFPPFGYAVFGILHIMMIISAYVLHKSQQDFHHKHVKACLEDFDDESKMIISNQIEEKQKQDEKLKILIIAIALIAFLILISILKKNGVG